MIINSSVETLQLLKMIQFEKVDSFHPKTVVSQLKMKFLSELFCLFGTAVSGSSTFTHLVNFTFADFGTADRDSSYI